MGEQSLKSERLAGEWGGAKGQGNKMQIQILRRVHSAYMMDSSARLIIPSYIIQLKPRNLH